MAAEALSNYSLIDAPQPAGPPPDPEAVQGQQLLEHLQQLDAAAQRQEEQGAELEAMHSMEQALAFRRELVQRGLQSKEDMNAAADRLAVRYNTLGVRAFKRNAYDEAGALLARASQLTDTEAGRLYFDGAEATRLRLRATTLNNLGCMERKRGDLERALEHTLQAAAIEGNSSAATNLNVSAILTQLGRHSEAIGAARRAIGLVQQRRQSGAGRPEDGPLLAIAYHNLGMAQEHSPSPEDRQDAVASYATAHQTAAAELGEDHETTASIARSLQRSRERASMPPPPSGPRPRGSRPRRSQAAAGGAQRLPPISRSPVVSGEPMRDHEERSPSGDGAAVFGMVSAEQLQREMNPTYSGETGVVLVDRSQPQRAERKRAPRRAPRGQERHAPEPPQQSRPDAPRRPAPQPREREPAARRVKAAAPVPPAPPPQRPAGGARRYRQQPAESPPAVSDDDSPRGARGARPQPPAQPPAQRAPRHRAREEAERERPKHTERSRAPPAHAERPPSQRSGGSGGAQARPVHRERSQPHQQQQQQQQPDDAEQPQSSAAEGAAHRRQQQGAERQRPQQGKHAEGAHEDGTPPQQAQAPAAPSARGQPRRVDDRDEERKKEDAVTYMHQLLLRLLKEEDAFELRFQAALRIQCLARLSAARREVERLRNTRRNQQMAQMHHENDAAKTVTRFIRGVADRHRQARVAEERAREEWARRHAAAIKIQKIARGWLARNLAGRRRAYYERIHWAVRVLQCFVRRSLANARVRRMHQQRALVIPRKLGIERRRHAATSIQKLWRGCRERAQTSALRGRMRRQRQLDGEALRRHSSTIIAACWRGHLARRRARVRAAEREKRREADHLGQARRHAAGQIQTAYRAHLGRRAALAVLSEQRELRDRALVTLRRVSATKIQCMVRSSKARVRRRRLALQRRAAHLEGKREHGALSLQRLWRGRQGRRRAEGLRGNARAVKAARLREMDEAAARVQAVQRGHAARQAERERIEQERELLMQRRLRDGAVPQPLPQPGQPMGASAELLEGAYRTTEGEGVSLQMLLDAAEMNGLPIPSLLAVASCGGGPAVSAGPPPDVHADFTDTNGVSWRMSRVGGGPAVLHQFGDFSPRLEVTRVMYDHAAQRMSLTDDATPGSGDTWTLPEHRLADVLCSIACFCATAGVPCQLDAVADFSDIYGGRWRLSRIAGGPPVLHQHGDFSPRLVVTRVLYDIPTRRLSLTEDSTPASSDAIRLHHDGVADAVHSIACWATTAGVPCDLDELTAPAADCACDFTSADGAQFRLSRFGGGPAVLHQYGDFSPRLMVTHVVYDIATHRLSFTTDTTPESADALQLPAETAAESVAAIAAFCATAGICCDTDAFCAAGELWRVAEGPLGVELHCGEAFLAYVEHAAYDCSKRRLVLEGYEVMLDQGSEGAVIARLAEVLARAGVPFARDSFSLADGSMVRIAPAADGTGLRLWGGGKERQKVTKITHNVATGRVALSTGALPNDPTALQLPPAGSSAVLRMLEPVCRAAGVPVLADCFEDAAGALCRMEPSAPGRLMLLRGNDEPARVRCLVHDRATGRFALSRHVSPHGPHGLQLPPDRGGSRGRALEAMRAACEAHGVPHDIGRVQPLLFPTLDGGEVRLAPGAGGGLVMHLDGRPCGAVERAWCDRAALLLTLGPAAEGLRLPAAGLESTLSSIAAICDDAGVPHELRGFRSEDGNTYCFAPNENEAEGGVAVFRNGARAGTAYNVKCDVATRRLQVDLGLGAFAPFMTVVLPPEGAEAVLGHLAALCRGAGVPHYLDTFSDAFHNVWEVRNEGCAVNAYRDGAFDRQVDAVAYDFTTKRLAIGKGADPSAPSAIQLRSEGLGEVLRRVCSVCDEAGVPHRRIDPRPETPRPSRPTERERDGLPEQGAIPTAPAGPLAVVMEVAGEMQLAVPALSTVAQLIAAEGIHPPRSRPATGESKASSAGTHYALPVLLEAAQELGVPCPSLATVADRQQYDARGLAALRVQCAVRRWRACVLVQRMREMADRLLEQQLHGAAATLIQTGMRGCLGRRRFRERRQRLRSAEQRRLREEDRQSDELKRSAQAAPPAPAPAPAPAAPSRAEVVRRRSSAAAAQQPPPEDAAREAARMARRQRELAAAEAQMLRERDERLRSEQRAQLLEQQYQEAMRRRQADDERLEQQLQQRRVDQQGRVRRLQPQEVQQEEWARRGMVSSPQSIAQPKTPPCSPVAAAAEGLMQSFGAPLRLTRAAEKLEQEASRRQLEEEDEAPRPSERPALPGDVPGMQFGVLQDAERIALQRSGKSAEELYRDNAACRIQRMARCRAARDARAHRKQLIEATRGVELSMWRQEVDDRAEAANRIQGISKVRKARVERERRREEQERRNAARADRDLRAAEADAATKIQCQVRGKIARCDAEERRRQREAEIQAQHEGDRRRSQQEEAASTDIQRLHRGRQARKEAEARRAQRGAQQRQREQAAAEEDISPTTAQRLGIDGAREAAAAAIQRGWRCHAARSEHSSRAQLLEAHLAAAHVEEEEQAAAAVRIQSGFRGHTARQEMQRRKEARQQRIDAQLEAERQLAP